MAETETKDRVEPTLVETKVTETKTVETKPVETKVEDKSTDETKSTEETKPRAVEPPEWMTKRLNQTTARNHELNAENARLRAQLAGKGETKSDETKPDESAKPAEVEAEVQRRTAAELSKQAWDKTCLDIANAGKAAHSDFLPVLTEAVGKLVGQDPARGQAYVNLVAAADAAGSAHELLYSLASNPDEFDRVLSLSPVKQAVELAKMVEADGKVVSRAPKPIRPVTNRGQVHESIAPDDPDRADQLDTKTWMARREKQERERRERMN